MRGLDGGDAVQLRGVTLCSRAVITANNNNNNNNNNNDMITGEFKTHNAPYQVLVLHWNLNAARCKQQPGEPWRQRKNTTLDLSCKLNAVFGFYFRAVGVVRGFFWMWGMCWGFTPLLGGGWSSHIGWAEQQGGGGCTSPWEKHQAVFLWEHTV